MSTLLTRRHVISAVGQVWCGTAIAGALGAALWPKSSNGDVSTIGPLNPPDSNGIRLPEGFTSRIIAVSLLPVAGYTWHEFPDGGATFAQPDGGWIYVSNSESAAALSGGASAIRFDASGQITSAYRILGGTRLNCAGGPTPWGTWLSCEEIAFGFVHECDPTGASPARKLRALGAFKHEAVAVDPIYRHLYLTEDESDGRLYRFTPQNYPDLSRGRLEVASVDWTSGYVSWRVLPYPDPTANPLTLLFPTRKQVSSSTPFNGGEGIWYHDGTVYFTTKGDNRVWALDTHTQVLRILYDFATSPTPVLRGVDNLTVSPSGQLLVAEDGGDMQLVVLDANGTAAPLLQVDGQSQSEITGPALNPSGTRLYFSSQRGPFNDGQSLGVTYEISGPFARILG
jgi:secreted PhoX family phosphatase